MQVGHVLAIGLVCGSLVAGALAWMLARHKYRRANVELAESILFNAIEAEKQSSKRERDRMDRRMTNLEKFKHADQLNELARQAREGYTD